MRIDTNSVGNYTPVNVKNIERKPNPAEVSSNIQSKNISSSKENLSAEEKDFFAKLYPQNKSEIVDYHFYERSGKLSGVKLGSLIDKRG